MKLFHFSENPAIELFKPHVAATQPNVPGFVWAIDEEHSSHYLFPRDCPRVCFWVGPNTTEIDRERFFGPTAAPKVIAMESGWLARLRRTELYVYRMPRETFSLQDESAGYFVSTGPVVPMKVEPAGDLLDRLVASGVELRITPSVRPLANAVAASTLYFSMIRLRYASEPRANPSP